MKRLQVAVAAGAVVLVIAIVLTLAGSSAGGVGSPAVPVAGNGSGDDGGNDSLADPDVPTADPVPEGDDDAVVADDVDGDEIRATWVTNGRTAATVTLEVADSPLEHERGLSFRESMPDDFGMLFVFDREADRAFWMKGMQYSLDIVFLDEAGRVINVETADPAPDIADSDLSTYESAAPAMYVVEMNAGFAERHGIEEGSWLAFESPNGTATVPDGNVTVDDGDDDGAVDDDDPLAVAAR